jgi:hypothetical protein
MLFSAPLMLAQVPRTISFQGYLTDPAGAPVDNPTPGLVMKFSLWDAGTGGVKVWGEETHTGVPVNQGLYNVILGSAGLPLDVVFDKAYYLEVVIGVETLAPRIALTSSAYSISSINAVNITAGTLDNARLDADLQDLADGVLSGSKVGVGIDAANITTNSLAVVNGGTGAATAAAARANLGLAIGTDVQALNAHLTDLSDGELTGSKVGTGINAANITTNSLAVGNGGTGATTAASARTNLGLVIGTNVQAFNTHLADLADGELSGTKVGTGINAANITGVLPGTVLGSGAANQLAFWNASVNGFSTNAGLFWDNMNSRLGIGTNAPKNLLDVEGGIAIGAGYSGTTTAPANSAIIEGLVGVGTNAPAYTLDIGSNTDRSLNVLNSYGGANPSYVLYGNSAGGGGHTEYGVYMTGENFNYFSGRVGIGKLVPGAAVDVDAADQYSMSINNTNNGSSYKYGLVNTITGDGTGEHGGIRNSIAGNAAASQDIVGVRNILQPNGTSSSYGIYNDLTTTSGTGQRVGSYNDVAGNGGYEVYGSYNDVSQSGSGNVYGMSAFISKASAGTAYGMSINSTHNGSGDSYILQGTSAGSTSGTKYGVYLSGESSNYFSGSVGIGIPSPLVKFHVVGTSSEVARIQAGTDPMITFYEGATYQGFIRTFNASDMIMGTPNGSTGLLRLQTNANDAVYINSNQLVGIARSPTTNRLEVNGEASKNVAGSWIANSDRRIKTDIREIDSACATIKKLRPVTFRYSPYWLNRNPAIKDKMYYNFIAQEFADVFPEAVKGSGEYLENDPKEILQIDTYNAQIVAIKALQELIDAVAALKEENRNLKESIQAHESAMKALQQQLTVLQTSNVQRSHPAIAEIKK